MKEVLDLLEDEEFDAANIYIEPPDDGRLSEEDSGEEDAVGSFNNLSGKQLQGLSTAQFSRDGVTKTFGLDDDDSDVESMTDDFTQPSTSAVGVQASICGKALPTAKQAQQPATITGKNRSARGKTASPPTKLTLQSTTNTGTKAKTPPASKPTQQATSDIGTKRSVRGKKAPPPANQTQQATSGKSSPSKRNWVKTDLSSKIPAYNLQPRHVIYSVDPVSLFESFFDDDVVNYLCDMTELYAHDNKGDHEFSIAAGEMRCFLAILLLSGYVGLPRWRMLWEVGSETYLLVVAEAMRRNRFELIKCYMHCADNAHLPSNDKFGKMRAVMCLLNERYLANAVFEENLCIDESMAPYFGRHGAKQFLKGKPIRFGYKFWCLCDRLGYLIQFEPYQGSGGAGYDRTIGLGPSVILDLISELPSNVSFRLYADRFFSSLKLVDHLSALGYGYTGTIMSNRVEHCPVNLQNEMAKKPRGYYDYRLDTSTNSLVVVWCDNRVVTMVSNTHAVDPVVPVLRWISTEKRKVHVDQPNVVRQYNIFMGGVDRMDQNVDNYRVGIRSKKWWWPVLMFCLDTSVHNAWQLYRKSEKSKVEPLDYLSFRRHIVNVYLQKYGVQSCLAGSSNSTPKSSKVLSKRIDSSVRFDSSEHWLISANKQNRCAVC